jgi:hypothetical protein
MSYTAYGMLLHSYRWRLHYRVALVTSEMNNGAFMVLAHHWLQVTRHCAELICTELVLVAVFFAHAGVCSVSVGTISQAGNKYPLWL